MLSWKRMLYVVLIVAAVSFIFMLYNINEERTRHIRITNIQEEKREFTGTQQLSGGEKPQVRLVGEGSGEVCQDIRRNMEQLFANLHYTVIREEELRPEELEPGELVVFCDASVGRYTDLVQLGDFIERGGHVILAAGLPEGNEDSYLWPILGIREKSVRENYNRFCFEKELFPVQADEMAYEGYAQSTWLAVGENADVYIRDGDSGVPLLYTCEFGKGTVCLINGTFLSDMQSIGLLTGAIGAVEDDFIYPVLGTKTVFLDNFPMLTYINDRLCMQMYGCSTESFIRDVVWPDFQGMSLRTQTPYTSSVLAVSSSEKSFPEINDSLFSTIGKSALQFDGELIYAVNCGKEGEVCLNDPFIEEFRSVFTNYEIQGLAIQEGAFLQELPDIPGTKIRAVRTSLNGQDAGFSCEKAYVEFPEATAGNTMEDGNLFHLSSVLAAYGMISHTFDVNTLIAEDEQTASWDEKKGQLGIFEDVMLKETSWLDGRVLSRMGDEIRSYLNLEYAWKREGNRIELACSDIVEGQAFFFRTNGRILSAEGLTFEDAGNGYYLLHVQQNQAVIIMEEE